MSVLSFAPYKEGVVVRKDGVYYMIVKSRSKTVNGYTYGFVGLQDGVYSPYKLSNQPVRDVFKDSKYEYVAPSVQSFYVRNVYP